MTDLAVAGAIGSSSHWRARRRHIPAAVFTGLVRACDPLLLLAGGVMSWLLAARLRPEPPSGADLLATLIAAWVAAACLRCGDAYRLSRLFSRAAQLGWLAIALMGGLAAFVAASTVVHSGVPPAPSHVAVWLAANLLLVGAVRLAAVQLALRWRGQGRLARRVALVGATEIGRAFTAEIRRHHDSDIDIVGVYDDAPAPGAVARAELPFLGDVAQLVADGQHGMLDTVVIALPAGDAARVAGLGAQVGHLALDVLVAPDLAAAPFRQVCTFGGVPMGLLARRPLSDWQVVQKALFDRILAALMLVAFGPMLLLLGLAVRLDSPGPVLFRQRRIGFGGRPFDCLKLRTMYHQTVGVPANPQTARGDRRITRVGGLLRRLSLDELPQLLNVLSGEMSLVGPRPHAPDSKAANKLFQDVVADYARRHRVKPGITGWAQVHGWRGPTTTEQEIEQRVLHDLYYIQNWSLALDLRILLMTAVRVCDDPKAF